MDFQEFSNFLGGASARLLSPRAVRSVFKKPSDKLKLLPLPPPTVLASQDDSKAEDIETGEPDFTEPAKKKRKEEPDDGSSFPIDGDVQMHSRGEWYCEVCACGPNPESDTDCFMCASPRA